MFLLLSHVSLFEYREFLVGYVDEFLHCSAVVAFTVAEGLLFGQFVFLGSRLRFDLNQLLNGCRRVWVGSR